MGTGPSFSSWNQALQHRFADLIQAIENVHLDSSDVQQIQSIAQAQFHIFDEITQPHLLHGDLWTVNILVKRDLQGPQISAILDADGASWGDPMADWTIFLLQRNAGTEVDAFWHGRLMDNRRVVVQHRNSGCSFTRDSTLEAHE